MARADTFMTSTLAARLRLALGCTILGLLSCIDTTAPHGMASPASVTIVAGDKQLVREVRRVPKQPSVVVKDSAGRPIAGARVLFAPGSGVRGRVDGAEQVTDADGIATVGGWTLDSSSFAPYTLTASAGSVTTTFTARAYGAPMAIGIVDIETSKLDGFISTSAEQVAEAGTPVPVAPAVVVWDAHGNPVPFVEVGFGASDNGAAVGRTYATSDTLGIARSGYWVLGPRTGKQTLAARFAIQPPNASAIFVAIATKGTPAAIRVDAFADVLVGAAGSVLAYEPRLSVVDTASRRVIGALVTVTAVSGGGSVLDTMSRTNESGDVARMGLTLGPSVGANVFQATSGAAKLQFVVNAVSGPPASIAIEEGDAQRVVAGMPLRIRPTILVRDAAGTPTPNVSVTWTSPLPSVCDNFPIELATNLKGRASACLYVLPVGTDPILVRVGTLQTTIAATVLARPASIVLLNAPSSLVLAADEAPPDMRISARVSFADGLPAVDYPVTLALDSPRGYGFTAEAVAFTDATGVATATLRLKSPPTAGTNLVRATVAPGLEVSTPLSVTAPIGLTMLAAGDAHSCGLSYAGAWLCWGNNTSGQLGDGTTISRRAPTRVRFEVAGNWAVAAADYSCLHYQGSPYAQKYPERVKGLILRGIFTLRKK